MWTADGFENLVANIATDRDKASHAGWSVPVRSPMEQEAMYRSGWLGRKIVDIPADDMTRRWRSWDGAQDLIDEIDSAEKKFQLRSKVTKALRWSRLFGSSAIIIGTKPRLGKPDEPLDYSKVSVGDLVYLHAEIAPYLTIRQWVTDLASADFGKPELYLYNPFRHGGASLNGKISEAGVSIQVHASRVIPFSGVPLPPFASLQHNRWGDSIFTSLEQTINTAGATTAIMASLLNEAKVDIVKVKDLAAYLSTQEGEDKLKKRFSLAMMLKSVSNQLVLDAEEDFDQKSVSFSGLSEVHVRIMQEVSGAADIPATRLLGQSPAGMSSTGESDLRNYYDHISAKQENELRPALELIDRIMFASDGINLPDHAAFRFVPLWQETPQQLADIALKKAQATKTLHDTGLIDDDALGKAVLSQLVEDQTYPGLAAAMAESETDGLPGDEDEAGDEGDLPAPDDPNKDGEKDSAAKS